jgi:hypothetical protein
MQTIFDILTTFLDTIQPPRTVDNCTIRKWCETNKNKLIGLSENTFLNRETVYVRQLYKLPDWVPASHGFYACEMLKDFPEPRKTIYQVMAIKSMSDSGHKDRYRILNLLLQKENEHEAGILSPNAAIYASMIVSGSFKETGYIGLAPKVMQKYKDKLNQ